MESHKNKRLTNKQCSQILKLPLKVQFEVPSHDQVLHMFNEMGYQPLILLLSSFKKSNIPRVWNLFFGVTLLCFIGSSTGMDKAKL